MNDPSLPHERRTADVGASHGCRTEYVRDRCPRCWQANRHRARERTRAIAYGTWTPFVDAAPARAHTRVLRASGMGVNRIAAIAGVGSGTIRHLIYGYPGRRPVRRIRPQTAARILTVRPGQFAMGARVDMAGTRRRLQALIAAGWSVRQLAAAAVARAFAQLELALPPTRTPAERRASDAARRYAASRGWRPPLAWDDIDADTPGTESTDVGFDAVVDDVDEIAVERAMSGDRVRLRPNATGRSPPPGGCGTWQNRQACICRGCTRTCCGTRL